MFFRTTILPFLLLCTLCAASQQAPVKYGPARNLSLSNIPDTLLIPGRVLVKLKPAAFAALPFRTSQSTGRVSRFGLTPLDQVTAVLKVAGLKRSFEKTLADQTKQIAHHSWGLDRWFTLELPAGTDIKTAIEKLQSLSDLVETAEPSFKRVLHGTEPETTPWNPSDSAYFRQWNLNNTGQEGPTSPGGIDADIDLPEAWHLEKGNPGVIVAVFDGGVDTTHPDLRQNLWLGENGERFGYNWYSGTPFIQASTHGTHIAGIVGAVTNNAIGTAGIAGGDGSPTSGVRIMSMQIFGGSGNLYGGDELTANAFVYAADHGAAIAQNSWGGGGVATILQDAIDYFIMNGGGKVMNGGIVIFSAGNSGTETRNFPADYAPVISVGATNYDDKKSWYSTYGTWVDIVAPGGELNINGGPAQFGGRKGILSTTPATTGSLYGWNQGSSMACPHVSGVAALCISKALGKISNNDLRKVLLTSTDDIYPFNSQYFGKLGSGRLNAFNALQQTMSLPVPSIDSVSRFSASQSCGIVTLTWQKNAGSDAVIIAASDSLLFGNPDPTLKTGDQLAGGGTIIYKGSGSSYSVSVPANTKKYYRIWSINGSKLSFHKTVSAYNPQQVSLPIINSLTDCNISISWDDQFNCPTDSVMLVAGNNRPLGKPSGFLQTGDILSGGGVVIYKGRDKSFLYNTRFDSTIFIQKWNFNANHQYSTTNENYYDSVLKPNTITSLSAKPIDHQSINISWQTRSNDCFGGDQYLLAVSNDGKFGIPSGSYAEGTSINGGGKIIYIGGATSFTQLGLTANTLYHYRAWKIRNGKTYSFGKQAQARTLCQSAPIALPFRDGFNGSPGTQPDLCLWDILNATSQENPISIIGASDNPSARPVEGTGMLMFNAYKIPENRKAILVSRAIGKGANARMDVRFRWFQDSSSYTSDAFAREGVAVKWSANNADWHLIEFYPRVPVNGLTGWSYKQLSLPAIARPYDTVYIAFEFNSGFGNNCYMDDLVFQKTSIKPSNGVRKYAVTEFTDSSNSWTHYYDDNGDRLLSMRKNNQFLGMAGQPGFSLFVDGDAGATILPFTGNSYVLAQNGWASMNRYYSWKTLVANSNKVDIRFYYTDADLKSLSGKAGVVLHTTDSLTVQRLFPYQIKDPVNKYNPDPESGHTNVPQASGFYDEGFLLVSNAADFDTAHWRYSEFGNGNYSATFTSLQTGGGSIGIGNGTAATYLSLTWVELEAVGNGNQAILTWQVKDEKLVDHYEVEFSTDNMHFETVGNVAATMGAPANRYEYAYLFPPNGVNYYRIRAVSTDGKQWALSEVKTLEFKAAESLIARPNPAKTSTIIQAAEPLSSIVIYDAAGKKICELKPSGRQLEINTSTWQKGLYWVNAYTVDNKRLVTTILKQ